jgi:peptidoglycan/LPS O-acetylase OafA/YrhL
MASGVIILSLAFALGGPGLSQFQGALAIGFGLFLVSALNQESLVGRVLSGRILKLIALSSYSTYLTHVAVIKALGYFGIVPMGPRRFIGPLSFVLTSAVVLVVGWFVYKYIEKPGLRLREVLAPRNIGSRRTSELKPQPAELSESASHCGSGAADDSKSPGKTTPPLMEPRSIQS